MGEISWATSEAARRSMQANRSRDTGPELAVRRLLFARGLRYRVSYRPVAAERISVDIAFPGQRIVVLIDGCFWHGCPDHYRQPKQHQDYWVAKMERNRSRDQRVNATLEGAGWTVLRFWEHDDARRVAAEVAAAVGARRPPRTARG